MKEAANNKKLLKVITIPKFRSLLFEYVLPKLWMKYRVNDRCWLDDAILSKRLFLSFFTKY